MHATTIGDTSFSVNKGDEFTWKYTAVEDFFHISDRVELTVEDITAGTYLTEDVAILHATLKAYNSTGDNYLVFLNTQPYMYFNETTNFFYSSIIETYLFIGWVLIIPTPLNLTLISEYLWNFLVSDWDDINVVGNQIITTTSTASMKYVFNENGLLTLFEVINATKPFMVLELDFSEDDHKIPFGYGFIFFSWFGILTGIIMIRRKIKN